MSRPALEDQKFELIKDHILNPDDSPLPVHLREALDRTVQASKILERNPAQKHAVALLMAKYKNISRAQAYEDCARAIRLFNSIHTFDYDYWHSWLLQDIAELLNVAKTKGDLKSWAMAQGNLLKAIGERPETQMDPKLVETHQFNIYLQVNNQTVNITKEEFDKLPADVRQVFINSIPQEISVEEAENIMKT